MWLRHHLIPSIAGGKICVWPQAERRLFPTSKLDISQLVDHHNMRGVAAPKPARVLIVHVYCHRNCIMSVTPYSLALPTLS